MKVYVSSDQNMRPYMEDRHCVKCNLSPAVASDSSTLQPCVLGVFDGHGGDAVAEFTSKKLPDIVLRRFAAQPNSKSNKDSTIQLFKDAFLDTDATAAKAVPGGKRAPVGSTACIAVIQSTTGQRGNKQHLWVANSGDSRCVLRTAKHVVQMSTDHKPEGARERARIYAHGGYVSNVQGIHRVQGNLSLSRSIGDWYMRPYVIPYPGVSERPLAKSDKYLLLATDGLWDVFTSKAACDFVDGLLSQPKVHPRLVPKRLIQAAKAKGSQDNVTVMLVML